MSERKLAQAVLKYFRHCRCDQQVKPNPPCLYCQAKKVERAATKVRR